MHKSRRKKFAPPMKRCLAAGKAQVDAALAEEKQAQAKALDEEFLRAKHALDGRFDANRDAWLDGLC